MSRSQVSRLCVEIDELVEACLSRPLEGAWPYLWLDASYIKVRAGGRIISRAVIVVVAVNQDGKREVLGVTTGPSEAEKFWTDFLRSLADRGLRGVKLVVADDHKGLRGGCTPGLQRHPSALSRSLDVQCPDARSGQAAHRGRGEAEDDLRPREQGQGRGPVGHCRRRAPRKTGQARRLHGRLA